jgi:hypothetical protein
MVLKIPKVLEQILAVLIQFVKDKKLEHQHQFVSILIFCSLVELLQSKHVTFSYC